MDATPVGVSDRDILKRQSVDRGARQSDEDACSQRSSGCTDLGWVGLRGLGPNVPEHDVLNLGLLARTVAAACWTWQRALTVRVVDLPYSSVDVVRRPASAV